MRKLDQQAMSNGFRYKVNPISGKFPALYVTYISDVCRILRDYPDDKFQVTDLTDLRKLYAAIKRRVGIAVHEANGDLCPDVTNSPDWRLGDTSAHAAAWGRKDDELRAEVEELARRCGFIEVSWPGLYPAFKDAGGYEVLEA
jgi:hypothetical protein